MEIGKTQNGFTITKEMLLNSIETFKQKPIVFNSKQTLENYTDDEIVDRFNNEYAIGFIFDNIELINEKEVYADIFIFDKHIDKWNSKYDNWCIQLDDDKSKFNLCSIEVF